MFPNLLERGDGLINGFAVGIAETLNTIGQQAPRQLRHRLASLAGESLESLEQPDGDPHGKVPAVSARLSSRPDQLSKISRTVSGRGA